MRYYFHIALNGDLLRDRQGTELPGIADMQCNAIDLAGELERDLARPKSPTGYYIEVTDEAGQRVFALPIYRKQFHVEMPTERQTLCA